MAAVIRAAGGRFVGKTRLQKTVCLLELAGYELGFEFFYYRHGPYSDDLSVAISDASALGLVQEETEKAQWGGVYSVFQSKKESNLRLEDSAVELVKIAEKADSVELELAVTAAFLAMTGSPDPWEEVELRKPQKATAGRLDNAKQLYRRLANVDVKCPLPDIV
ncbi:MAG: hypothetical protein K9G30_04090 [Parvibaculum sp.]|nr:hypothetical protein [Parvibaculum sp.]